MFNYCQFACYEDVHLHGLDLMLVACTEAMHASICGVGEQAASERHCHPESCEDGHEADPQDN